MFRRKALRLLFLVVLYAVGVGVYVLTTKSGDAEEYEKLLEKSEGTGVHAAPKRAEQTRQGIIKHIWLTREGARLQLRLHGETSRLELDKESQARIDVTESLEGVVCWIQEALLYRLPDGREVIPEGEGQWRLKGEQGEVIQGTPEGLTPWQQVRYLVADEARYHYSQNKLLAQTVDLYQYELEGHRLPESPEGKLIMKGKAKSVELHFLEEDVEFKAEKLTATFFSTQGGV